MRNLFAFSGFENLTNDAVRFFSQILCTYKVQITAIAAAAAAFSIHQRIARNRIRQKWDSVGENVVVLHAARRGKACPHLSPFVIKLETYLRMAGIKYEFDDAEPRGPKGKMPWISLNGETYADSQHIIEFLGNKFNKDFTSALTSEQKAVARAMQVMTDEHLFWGLLWWRFIRDNINQFFSRMNVPFMDKPLVYWLRYQFRKYLWCQGLGRHSDAEIEKTMEKDLKALSIYLGDKAFMMGSSPCELDCSVFGLISQFVWGLPGSPFAAMVQNDYQNLLQYCLRMKAKFYPDWDDLLDN